MNSATISGRKTGFFRPLTLQVSGLALGISMALTACKEKAKLDLGAYAETVGDEGYRLRDTVVYGTDSDGGIALKVSFRGKVFDTLELRFGLHPLGADTVVYRKVHSYPSDGDTLFTGRNPERFYGQPDSIMMSVRGRRENLSRLFPIYGIFSSPSYIGGAIYYWMIGRRNDSIFAIYAARFDVRTRKVDTLFLYDDALGTDDTDYFTRPFLEAGKVVYGGSGGMPVLRFDPGFTRDTVAPEAGASSNPGLRGDFRCDGSIQAVSLTSDTAALKLYVVSPTGTDSLVFAKKDLIPPSCIYDSLDAFELVAEDLVSDKEELDRLLGADAEGYGGSKDCKGLQLRPTRCETDPIHVYWNGRRKAWGHWRM